MSLYLNCQLDIQFVVSQSSRGVADGRAGIGWQGTLPSHLQITPPRTPLYARTDPHTFLCPSQVVTTHIPCLKESCREVSKKCELTACNKNGLKSGTWQEYLTHLSVNGTPQNCAEYNPHNYTSALSLSSFMASTQHCAGRPRKGNKTKYIYQAA